MRVNFFFQLLGYFLRPYRKLFGLKIIFIETFYNIRLKPQKTIWICNECVTTRFGQICEKKITLVGLLKLCREKKCFVMLTNLCEQK
jgi:hypothetical protein